MRGEWTYAALWLNVLLIGVVGCGGEATPTSGEAQSELLEDVRPDAEATQVTSDLSPEERKLLLRAKGREWEDWSSGDIRAFFSPHPDSASLLYVWDPVAQPGATGLGTIVDALVALSEEPFRVAIAVVQGGDTESELLALRESQTVLTAVRVPAARDNPTSFPGNFNIGNLYMRQSGTEKTYEFATGTNPTRAVEWALVVEAGKPEMD